VVAHETDPAGRPGYLERRGIVGDAESAVQGRRKNLDSILVRSW